MFMDEAQAYGCAQCGKDVRTAIVQEFKSVRNVVRFLGSNEERILMVPEFVFFSNEVLSNLRTATNVAAVIVYEEGKDVNGEDLRYPPINGNELSTDRTEPNEKYNKYPSRSPEAEAGSSPSASPFARNEVGKNNKFFFFPFNIFHVNATVAAIIRRRNERFPSTDEVSSEQEDTRNTSPTSPRYKAQSIGQMFACPSIPTPSPDANDDVEEPGSEGSALALLMNSKTCLNDKTCLPIGGQSIWSALEHIEPNKDRQILAITAPMDSLAFFPDLALGASAEIASLAVLMAVAKRVAAYRREPEMKEKDVKRQPVYFVWNAQSSGYTGSARFLKDVKYFDCKTENDASKFKKGCDDQYMDSLKFLDFRDAKFTVLNIGQLTTPLLDPTTTFYKQGGLEGGPNEGALEQALDDAFTNSTDEVTLLDGLRDITPIDASQSFRRYMPDAEVITLTSYQNTFTNTLYHSMYDNETLIQDRTPLYAAAHAIANAVISLAFEVSDAQVKVDSGVIDGVLTCMTGRGQWADCDMASEYLREQHADIKGDVIPGNYPGSFFPSTRLADRNPSGFAKLAFIRSFLAFHNRYEVDVEAVKCSTATKDEKGCDDFLTKVNEHFQAANHSQLRTAFCTSGICVASDTYTHNAFGAALKSLNRAQSAFEYNESATGRQSEAVIDGENPLEAGWTESVWDSDLNLCGLVEDTPLFGGIILGLGVLVLLLSMFVVYCFHKELKKPSRHLHGLSIAAANPRWAEAETRT